MELLSFRYRVLTAARPTAVPVEAGQEVKVSAFFCQSPGCAMLLSGTKDWSEWQRWGEEEEDDGEVPADEEEEAEGEADSGNPPATPAKPA